MTKKFVLAALSVVALSGCIKGADVDKTDFGPEEKIEDVSNALSKPTEGMNPLDIKVGEFFAIEDTQELAGGAAFAILKDTGATITGKTEDSTHVMFSGVIHEATYQNDGSVSKVSREGNLLCVSKVQGGCGEESSSSVTPETKSATSPKQNVSARTLASLPAPLAALLSSKQTLAFTSPEKLLTQAVNTKAVRQTFHKLTTSVQQVQPPARVRARPNCLGIPNCLITIHRIGFDQVIWEDEKPTRVHIDAVMSADVPYLSRNLSTCYTAVADVDSSTGGVLVKQCSNIFDFKFSDAQ